MHRRHYAPLPHPFITSFFFLLIVLLWKPCELIAQSKKPSRKENNISRIDSVYTAAERSQLNTSGVLRYEFYFSEHDQKKIMNFSVRMEKDSFELGQVRVNGKEFYFSEIRNTTYSRQNMFDLEHKLRGLKYKYSIDHYLGFSIHPADLNPVAVPDSSYTAYLKSLSDAQLYWVGNRLLNLKNYPRAIKALEMGVKRNYYPDTSHYRYGLALVATNEPNDGIQQWRQAVKQNSQYLEAYLSLGKIHFENGYFEKALEYYMHADTLSPKDSQILLHISESLYALQRYNQSYSYAKRSHELDRRDPYTKSLLKLLKQPGVKYARKKFPEM